MMKLQMVGCSHHNSSLQVRERLAFSPDESARALDLWQQQFPNCEAVLLSTCNRTELYAASEQTPPTLHEIAEFLTSFHKIPLHDVFDELTEQSGEGAIRHLFTVAASLDSMVVGEAQILSQVKRAYDLACQRNSTGPITHEAFQGALHVAKRVASETTINQRKVCVASVAISDFASQIFERFDDKKVLVIGAGETAEETLRYLVGEGARDITVINRSADRAREVAERWQGRAVAWETLPTALAAADLVISTTAASEPVFTLADYRKVEHRRYQRPLFILDLAVPRDFDARIDECLAVYLYSLDDLKKTCEANRKAREKQWPAAERIIDEETSRFLCQYHHRMTAPTILRLRESYHQVKQAELQRLLNKIPQADEQDIKEIRQSFDRVVNKLLHVPMQSLRDEARNGTPHGLLEALKRLFQLKDS